MPSQKPVALVVGASRGIGRQVAIDLAKNGYAVVVAAKSVTDPSKLPHKTPGPKSAASTVTTVAREIASAGGEATPVQVDVRSEESVNALVAKTIAKYNRLDVVVYNSGAIWWASVADTPLKRFQLMQRVNPEGLYAVVQAALPHLRKSPLGGRVVVVSPPIYSRFFRGKAAYAMGKVGMSVLTKGLAMDLEREGRKDMACGAATEQFTKLNPSEQADLRKPTIFSDAILAILRSAPAKVNGQLLLDEDFLRDECGVTDFGKYSVVPGSAPRRIMPARLPDLTVAEQDDEGKRVDSTAKSRL
ncbi:NAD(P)-binding protein [Trichoderma citrinoviride]|uniref:NAD(P)-binding protein n=1 Tax=Trichoderma citrinoviride TaxID=58853 RepID=A0A2T4B504_9HYPO|nr:NAD(P)-binding protein [Trichoderma citrinoviride]PTB64291.1 NAD(P)-binding protein [Trichoderma citrinoviride]